MQIESLLQKPIQNKQHIVQMILRVAIFILFFYTWSSHYHVSTMNIEEESNCLGCYIIIYYYIILLYIIIIIYIIYSCGKRTRLKIITSIVWDTYVSRHIWGPIRGPALSQVRIYRPPHPSPPSLGVGPSTKKQYFLLTKWINSWVKMFQIFESVHIYMKDAECAETNEKSMFRFLRFLVFEIWTFLY